MLETYRVAYRDPRKALFGDDPLPEEYAPLYKSEEPPPNERLSFPWRSLSWRSFQHLRTSSTTCGRMACHVEALITALSRPCWNEAMEIKCRCPESTMSSISAKSSKIWASTLDCSFEEAPKRSPFSVWIDSSAPRRAHACSASLLVAVLDSPFGEKSDSW